MRIRSRRLLWGLIGCLALACLGLLRPARTWLDQRLLARWLDPNLSVSQLRLHANQGVLELREPKWFNRQGSQALGIAAHRGWLAFEAEPLLDKRLSIPKLLLEDAELKLTDVAITDPSSRKQGSGSLLTGRSVWQEALMERVQSLDWQQLAREFTTFLSDDDLPRTWQERMERWIARSQQAAGRAESLEASTTSLVNPLRLESEQQLQLQQLAELLQEQTQVSQQFVSLEQLVTATIRRIEERMEHDVERSAEVVEQQTADPNLVAAIAAELVRQAAEDAWGGIRDFVEVAERVARAEVGVKNSPSWNIDVRATHTPAIVMSEILADGIFYHGTQQTPFQMSGEYQAAQQADYGYQSRSMWHLHFDAESRPQSVLVTRRHGTSSLNDLQLSSTSAEGTVHNRLVLASDGETFEGEFYLLVEDWSDVVSEAPSAPLLVHITGDWRQNSFEVLEPLPEWLLETAREKIEAELLRTHGKLVSDLQVQAAQRLAELRAVQSQLELLAAQNGQYGTQIAAIEAKLQAHFQELNRSAGGDVEYARRSGSTLR
jgi:hypothetical protein